ncbi:MAG: hypothetical protein ACRDVE_18700, partial [Actinocrinis sp.]
MRIHPSAHVRFFSVLNNDVLRDGRLSFCARGILAHVLSLPDGHRFDIRSLTERTPEGRQRVASALRELERFGYLRRTVTRGDRGRVSTEVEVFETPGVTVALGPAQVGPGAGKPDSGQPGAGPNGDNPVKERDKEPTPAAPVHRPANGSRGGASGGAGSRQPSNSLPNPRPDPSAGLEPHSRSGPYSASSQNLRASTEAETVAGAALLARVGRAEPQLALGERETVALAPLVAEWRRRGASDLHILGSMTRGLPRGGVRCPVR